MPTYEYKCEKCEHRFEKFQRMTDEPLTNCPKCNGPVHRLISPGAGIIFKESGMYTGDYKHQIRCGNEQTCCGRNTPCETPPCEE
jgi:putative FmdB family regulatory protein